MAAITPEAVGNTFIVIVVAYALTFIYSIYMAVVNWRQAKVKEVLKETNKILLRIEEKMK